MRRFALPSGGKTCSRTSASPPGRRGTPTGATWWAGFNGQEYTGTAASGIHPTVTPPSSDQFIFGARQTDLAGNQSLPAHFQFELYVPSAVI